MTAAAFSAVLGPWGGKMVSFSLIFFAVACNHRLVVLWGTKPFLSCPSQKNAILIYRLVFLLCCLLGAVTKLDLVWGIADTIKRSDGSA